MCEARSGFVLVGAGGWEGLRRCRGGRGVVTQLLNSVLVITSHTLAATGQFAATTAMTVRSPESRDGS